VIALADGCRQNRSRKAELEQDWSDKKETDELDTFCVELRNEHTRKQFHPGVVKFLEQYGLTLVEL